MLSSLNLQPVLQQTIVSDRRHHRRVDTTCNALIRLSATLTFRCLVRNVSMHAAQVLCEPRYALLVHRNRPLDLSIAFPFDGAVRGFTARCRAMYCESLSEARPDVAPGMVMGLEFAELDQGPRQLLAGFIGTLAEAPG